MILKASQRGHAGELARHLLNAQDNEHIEVHAVTGFMAEDVTSALQEIHAISLGTKCRQPIFSVSLSPPKDETVTLQDFEEAIARIAESTGLQNQPHLVVFHEKNGRRHCHAVFSRIDSQTMTAINLPFYKNKLMEISKDLYIQHGWKLPQGHIDHKLRNPLNFTREQWQQAKRLKEDPKVIKRTLKECWSISDNKQAFAQALEQQGYYLAKGDRRGFVVIDWRGEVYSLSRWLDIKTKALKDRLGDPKALPSVTETQANLDRTLIKRMKQFTDKIRQDYEQSWTILENNKQILHDRHQQARKALAQKQQARQEQEVKLRQERFSSGLRGFWQRLTGRHAQLQKENEMAAYQAYLRDRAEKDRFIQSQLQERSRLQERLEMLKTRQEKELVQLKKAVIDKLPEDQITRLQSDFEQSFKPQRHRGLER